MRPRLLSAAGLSLVEVAVVLSVMAVLTGVLAPAGATMMSQARDVRALRDCETIRVALVTLLNDTGQVNLRLGGRKGALIDLLVTAAPSPDAAGDAERLWTRDVDAAGTIDWLDRHLVTNDPAGRADLAWPLPTLSGELGWRGAYLATPTGADPWGRRYAVNVRHLGTRADVLVLSAGPDGVIETPFEARGLTVGGDDVAALVK